jgi:thiol:disulfide interchange protein DsbC
MFFHLFKKCVLVAFTMAVFSFSLFSFAEETTTKHAVDQATVEQITQKMSALRINVISVSLSPVDGLYEVITDKGIFYNSKNLQFLFDGNIYDLDNQMTNISENSFAALRKSRLKDFEKDMIIYKAPEEKHVITVFTDTTCVYCKKLHANIPDYNKLGITVRYLAFPRAGVESSTAKSMAAIWCADDRNLAMDNAKKGRTVRGSSSECLDMINKQYALGVFFGVKGTPAIILEDGTLTPGYVPAENLSQMLDQKFK